MTVSHPRIAMLSIHSCPVGILGAKDTGGMSVYVRELARELGKQGFPVDIYTRVHDPKDKQIIKLGQNVRLIHLKAGKNLDSHKLALYPYIPDFACNLENFRKRNSLQYDLIFSHYWLSGYMGKYLQCWWNVPHITMFHTLGAVKNAIGVGEDEPELRIEAEKDLAQNCHYIIAATEQEKAELIQYYGASPERVGVVPCGVNLDLFRPVGKEKAKKHLSVDDENIILFVGRIEPLKGIEPLMRAITYLQNGNKPRLMIIGGDEHSYPEIDRLKRLSRELQIEDSVNCLGLIEHEKLPFFYSAADVCVIPSYYESFGLIALEALACGTPVVAANVGDLKTIIHQGETGYVVIDNSPGSLADKISLILSQPSSEMKSALSIRASVTRFSWSNIAEMIIKEFREVLASYTPQKH